MKEKVEAETGEFVDEIESDIERKKLRRRSIISKTTSSILGVAISCLLYFKMLECNDCNIVVIAYFSIIGLCCFMNIGLPLDKLLSAYNN